MPPANLKVAFHPDYFLPLPEGHPFPMAKYPLARERLRASGLLAEAAWLEPDEAGREDLERVHTVGYLDRLYGDALTPAEVRALGVPWTPRLLRRSRLAVQGTLLAARAALEDGLAGNLAGGTHHAFADHGEGFCVLNDVAVAVRRLQSEGAIRRALVVDLDVHQGNGTAAMLAHEPRAFTFSMHGRDNYPARKEKSDLDLELPRGTTDGDYLSLLHRTLPALIDQHRPDLIYYLAGADPLATDRLGTLALTPAGLAERDAAVYALARRQGIPLVLLLGGGYPRSFADVSLVLDAHAETVALALDALA